MFAVSLYSTLMARENTVTIVGRKSGVNTIVNTTTAAKMNMTLLYLILKLKRSQKGQTFYDHRRSRKGSRKRRAYLWKVRCEIRPLLGGDDIWLVLDFMITNLKHSEECTTVVFFVVELVVVNQEPHLLIFIRSMEVK